MRVNGKRVKEEYRVLEGDEIQIPEECL
ncbi:hypothetical protein IJS64_00295 [bacterium]|nr:hypothetical protein [bacterium]MBR4567206.1 hypothetical protein [bacterium]